MGSQNDRPAYPTVSRMWMTLAMKSLPWTEVMSTVHAVESGSSPSRILAVRQRYTFKQPPRDEGDERPPASSSTDHLVDPGEHAQEPDDNEQAEDYREIDDKVRQRLLDLHRRIGHRNNRMLRRLGVALGLLRAAQNLEYSVCNQRANRIPLKKASIHSPALPGVSVSSDGFYWSDRRDRKVYNGTIAVDDGTRLTAVMLGENLEEGGHRRSSEVLDFLYQRWIPSYCKTKAFRTDAEGCCMDNRAASSVRSSRKMLTTSSAWPTSTSTPSRRP